MIGLLRSAARWYLRWPTLLKLVGPLALMALLWRASAQQPTQMISGLLRTVVYNSMHVVAYAALASAWIAVLWQDGNGGHAAAPRRGGWIAVALSGLYGVIDEIHQSFVPGRVPSFGDVLADLSGAVLATMLWRFVLLEDVAARRAVPWCVLACCASVTMATFVPW